MKSLPVTRVAAILLLASSGSSIAGELPFNVPDTRRAQETGQLLHRAAHALYALSSAGGSHAAQVSNLWLFPPIDPRVRREVRVRRAIRRFTHEGS
jgi:hypothetical protein